MRGGGWICLVLAAVALSSCTSAWERHQQLVEQNRDAGNYPAAASAQRWLVQQAFYDAPAAQRGPLHDAARLLTLGNLLGQSGQVATALEAYREAITLDPYLLEDVLTGVGMLPLPAAERDAHMEELLRQAISIDPRSNLRTQVQPNCWSYSVREVRLRRIWTRRAAKGLERVAIYDARPWVYDAEANRWRADGDWDQNAGEEIQPVGGQENPNYQALLDADGGFYADGVVPPCHAKLWRGPYDAKRHSGYIARALP